MTGTLDWIDTYILPWRTKDPRDGFDQAEQAERAGVGGIILSERWDNKELGVMMGALSQRTRSARLVAGLTHFGTRHPVVIAGLAATLQILCGGRFELGFGRGQPPEFRKLGIPVIHNQGMADFAQILRHLWAGKKVNYSGPAGDYPELSMPAKCPNPPPLLLGALGEKTLALAGAHFDGVVLGPMLTTDGVRRSVETVRAATLAAGRDPTSVKILSTVIVVPDSLSAEQRADVLEARAVSYFMHREAGLPLIKANGWETGPMDRLVEEGLAALEFAGGDISVIRRRFAEAAHFLPEEWLTTGAAVGTARECAARLEAYRDAGANEIIIHGITPAQQLPVLDVLRGGPVRV